MQALDEIRNDVEGVALLRDWLGSGEKPVRQHIADVRAVNCLDCPMHRPGRWWENISKGPIAAVIRRELEIKHRIRLETVMDEALGMCQVCGCCLRLKVWTPIKHLRTHTTPEMEARYPSNCWVPPELANL